MGATASCVFRELFDVLGFEEERKGRTPESAASTQLARE